MIEELIADKEMDCTSLSDRIMRLEWQIEYYTNTNYAKDEIADLMSQRNKAMSKLEHTRRELLEAQKKQLRDRSRVGVQ